MTPQGGSPQGRKVTVRERCLHGKSVRAEGSLCGCFPIPRIESNDIRTSLDDRGDCRSAYADRGDAGGKRNQKACGKNGAVLGARDLQNNGVACVSGNHNRGNHLARRLVLAEFSSGVRGVPCLSQLSSLGTRRDNKVSCGSCASRGHGSAVLDSRHVRNRYSSCNVNGAHCPPHFYRVCAARLRRT